MSERVPETGFTTSPETQFEAVIERVMLASRWTLIVFYFGLAFALVLYGVAFMYKCIKLALSIFTLTDNQVILAMLGEGTRRRR